MTKLIISILFSTVSLTACTKTKAPGTTPSDMTAAQHREECKKHKATAAAYEKQEKEKFTHTAHYAKEEHQDAAKQHADAAKESEAVIAKEGGQPRPIDSDGCE